MEKYKVGMVSLGCDKNRVDSELILGSINKHYEITNDAKKADIIIVNTCGFIESAKQESIDTILEMAEYKNKYKCKMLIATGCLTQRYGDELLDLIPEIDILMGVNDYMKLHRLILDFIKDQKRISSATYSDEGINEGIRLLTTKQHTAYVRIAEGCNNFCTYCIIPKIRGKFRSRLEKNILDEVNMLVNNGVKEIIDVLDVNIKVCGLVKDEYHNTSALINHELMEIKLDKRSPLYQLLAVMQDEIHRFAISYHRKLRTKKMTKSLLDDIVGLGSVRKSKLLKHFGSLKKIREASEKELTDVLGQKIGQSVYEQLKKLKE